MFACWLYFLLNVTDISFYFQLFVKAVGFEGNVRKQEDARRVVESIVKHFGRLDILVNAAAGNFLVSAEDLSPKGFRTGNFIKFAMSTGSSRF